MALIVAGANHRSAPLSVRECFAHSISEIGFALERLRAEGGVAEGVLLSTCNRTEFYLLSRDDSDEAVSVVWTLLGERLGAAASPHGYVLRDREAVAHLYRVTAGLDSMILGEAQIHGQVRDAWEHSRRGSGAVLNRLFQTALLAGSRVRNETGIAIGAASVSSAAVQLARKIFGSLAGRRAMVLGAGEMAELALECLTAEGVRTAIVANRTFDRATELAKRYGATALNYESCWHSIEKVDLMLCSTSAPHTVLSLEQLRPSLRSRGDRPLCILDIALPRDVEPAVRQLSNVFLYDLDDLQSVVSHTLDRRREEIPLAENIIREEVDRFWTWLAGLEAVPVLKQVRGEMERLRERELASAMRRLSHLPDTEREQIEHFSRSLMNKFLHAPSTRLRSAAANGSGAAIVEAARYLFGLDDTNKSASADDVSSNGSRAPAADAGVRSRPPGARPAPEDSSGDAAEGDR